MPVPPPAVLIKERQPFVQNTDHVDHPIARPSFYFQNTADSRHEPAVRFREPQTRHMRQQHQLPEKCPTASLNGARRNRQQKQTGQAALTTLRRDLHNEYRFSGGTQSTGSDARISQATSMSLYSQDSMMDTNMQRYMGARRV
jgi:hypothetical protein